MNKDDLRIVYMGTPDFAVAPLKKLIDNGFNIVGVITVADKPAGRGQKLRQSPVKVYAESKGLNILQPTNLKSDEFDGQLKALNPNLQIVVAFRMLPEKVWSLPKIGTINLHASLLPQYRGAAPINWAVINGEKETGVTTFFIEKQIDTGEIILQKKVKIESDETAGTLHDKLMETGSELIVETCNKFLEGKSESVSQINLLQEIDSLKPAPKIFKADCKIDWNQPSEVVKNFIHGLSPYPGAFCKIALANNNLKTLKVFNVEIESKTGDPGKIEVVDNRLIVYTADTSLALTLVQLEGKKRMATSDFLRGVEIG